MGSCKEQGWSGSHVAWPLAVGRSCYTKTRVESQNDRTEAAATCQQLPLVLVVFMACLWDAGHCEVPLRLHVVRPGCFC